MCNLKIYNNHRNVSHVNLNERFFNKFSFSFYHSNFTFQYLFLLKCQNLKKSAMHQSEFNNSNS